MEPSKANIKTSKSHNEFDFGSVDNTIENVLNQSSGQTLKQDWNEILHKRMDSLQDWPLCKNSQQLQSAKDLLMQKNSSKGGQRGDEQQLSAKMDIAYKLLTSVKVLKTDMKSLLGKNPHLQNLDHERLQLIMCFLFDVGSPHPSQKSRLQSQLIKNSLQFQGIVCACFARLMSEDLKQVTKSTKMLMSGYLEELENSVMLITDLIIVIFSLPSDCLKKEFMEVLSKYSNIALTILSNCNPYRLQEQQMLVFMEQMIYALQTIMLLFINSNEPLIDKQDLLMHIYGLLKLNQLSERLLFCQFKPIIARHILSDSAIQVSKLHVEKDVYSETSLLNMQINLMRSYFRVYSLRQFEIVNSKDPANSGTQLLDKFLQGIDFLVKRQVQLFLKYEDKTNPGNKSFQLIQDRKFYHDQGFLDGKLDLLVKKIINDKRMREQWHKVTMLLYEVHMQLLPKYYQSYQVTQYKPDSFFGHFADLFRCQVMFVLRHSELTQFHGTTKYMRDLPLLPAKKYTVISTFQNYATYVNYFLKKKESHQKAQRTFGAAMLYEFMDIMIYIEQGVFDQIDTLGFVKVYYLLFLKRIQNDVDLTPRIERQPDLYFRALHNLFSLNFFEDKYLKYTEQQMQLGLVSDVQRLKDIIKLETYKDKQSIMINHSDRVEIENTASTVTNQILIQNYALQMLVQISNKQNEFNQACWIKIATTITNNIQSSHIQNTVSNKLSSKLYQYLKLALQLLVLEETFHQTKIYNILIENDDQDGALPYYFLKLKKKKSSVDFIVQNRKLLANLLDKIKLQKNPIATFYSWSAKSSKHSSPSSLLNLSNNSISSPQNELSPRNLQDSMISADTSQNFTNQSSQHVGNNTTHIQNKSSFMSIAPQVQRATNVDSKRMTFDFFNQTIPDIERVYFLLKRFIIFMTFIKKISDTIVNMVITDSTDSSQSVGSQQSFNNTEFKKMKDLEFKMLVLRNICFVVNSLDKNGRQEKVCKLINFTLKQFEKQLIQTKIKQLQFIEENEITESRKTLGINDDAAENQNDMLNLDNQKDKVQKIRSNKLQNKNVAKVCVTILSNYLLLKKKSTRLKLIDNDNFMDEVLKPIQRLISEEGTYTEYFVRKTVELFLFPRQEQRNLMLAIPTEQPISHSKQLQLLFESLASLIKRNTDPNQEPIVTINRLIDGVKYIVDMLYKEIVLPSNPTFNTLKFARSLNIQCIQSIKKVHIFLREHEKEQLENSCLQFKSIVIKLLRVYPQTHLMREYFSLLREVYYYNQKMDKVDCKIIQDLLEILNEVIIYKAPQPCIKNNEMQAQFVDYLNFTSSSQGILVWDMFTLSEECTMVVHFKLQMDDILRQLKQTKRSTLPMYFFSMHQKAKEKSIEKRYSFDLTIEASETAFWIKEDNQQSKETQQKIPLNQSWHQMLVRFKNQKTMIGTTKACVCKVYIDNLQVKLVRLTPSFIRLEEFHIAFGDSAYKILHANDELATQSLTDKPYSHFFGKMSLPFFYKKLPEFKQIKRNAILRDALSAYFFNMANKKRILNINELDLNSMLRTRDESHKNNKKYVFKFVTYDELNEQIILRHFQACQNNNLVAMHAKRPSNVFVCLGGFKLMLLLIEKTVTSNIEAIERDRVLPSRILKWIFKILRSLLISEYKHIRWLVKSQELFIIMKYALIRIAKHSVVTKELLDEIKMLFIQKTNDKKHNQFLQEFYHELVTNILFDKQFCSLNCLVPSSSSSEDYNQLIIINETVDVIQNICGGKDQANQNQYHVNQVNILSNSNASIEKENQTSQKQNEFSDWSQTIVNRQTIAQLIDFIDSLDIQNNLPVLFKVADCVKAGILYLSDVELIKNICQKLQKDISKMSRVRLRLLLHIVYHVILENNSSFNQLFNSQFFEIMAQNLLQFYQTTQDELKLNHLLDSIIAQTLLILQQLCTIRQKGLGLKKVLNNKNAVDFDKNKLVQVCKRFLCYNTRLFTCSYLTLMMIAFNKKPSCRPEELSPDQITNYIKTANRGEQYSDLEIEIDLYMLCVLMFPQFHRSTKQLFLNDLIQLIKNQTQCCLHGFLMIKGEPKNQPQLSQDQLSIKDYLCIVVDQCFNVNNQDLKDEDQPFSIATDDAVLLVNFAQEALTEMSIQLFVVTFDKDRNAPLTQLDEQGIQLFQSIFMFFSRNHSLQLKLLKKVIIGITMTFEEDLSRVHYNQETLQKLHVKLSLKLIVLVQFIEEIFVQMKRNLINNDDFIELVGVLILCLHHFQLLAFDFPYKQQFTDSNQSDQIQTVSSDIAKFLRMSGFGNPPNFISGGPLRCILHILLQCNYDQFQSVKNFDRVLSMLGFVINKTDSQYLEQVQKDNNFWVTNRSTTQSTMGLDRDQLFANIRQAIFQTKHRHLLDEEKHLPSLDKTKLLSYESHQELKRIIGGDSGNVTATGITQINGMILTLITTEIYELLKNLIFSMGSSAEDIMDAKVLKNYLQDDLARKVKIKNLFQMLYSTMKYIFDESFQKEKGHQKKPGQMFIELLDKDLKEIIFNFVAKTDQDKLQVINLCSQKNMEIFHRRKSEPQIRKPTIPKRTLSPTANPLKPSENNKDQNSKSPQLTATKLPDEEELQNSFIFQSKSPEAQKRFFLQASDEKNHENQEFGSSVQSKIENFESHLSNQSESILNSLVASSVEESKDMKQQQQLKQSTKEDQPPEQRVSQFIDELFNYLEQLFQTTDQAVIDKKLVQVIRQTVQKKRVSKIMSAFSAASSDKFKREFWQLIVNSKQIFETIKQDINKVKDYQVNFNLQRLKRQQKLRLSINRTSSMLGQSGSNTSLLSTNNRPVTQSDSTSSVVSSHQSQNELHSSLDSQNQSLPLSMETFGFGSTPHQQAARRTSNLSNSANMNSTNLDMNNGVPGMGMLSQRNINENIQGMQAQTDPDLSKTLYTFSIIESNRINNCTRYSLKYYYAKKQYFRTIRMLEEDESSIWFDNLEQNKKDFDEIKQLYKILVEEGRANLLTAAKTLDNNFKKSLQELNEAEKEILKEAKRNYGTIKEINRNWFVSQRQNTDKWGRMLLLKPDRKYHKNKSWVFYKYAVKEYFESLFSASLLAANDFKDQRVNELYVQQQRLKQLNNQQASDDNYFQQESSIRDESNISDQQHLIDQESEDANTFRSLEDVRIVNSVIIDGEDETLQGYGNGQDSVSEASDDSNDYCLPYYLAEKPYQSKKLEKMRQDLLHQLSTNKILQSVLEDEVSFKVKKWGTNDDEKRKVAETQRKADEKIDTIMKIEKKLWQSASINTVKFQAQLITVQGFIWGTIFVSMEFIMFKSFGTITPEDIVYALHGEQDQKLDHVCKIFKWSQIEEIFRKKFLNVRQGIEMYTINKKSFMFNLCEEERADEFIKVVKGIKEKLQQMYKSKKFFDIINNPIEAFRTREYIEEWRNGEKSNQEFLLAINKYASRSFQDISQYPIFPWVIKDYESNYIQFKMNKEENKVFRDLSKHTGILSEHKQLVAQEKYDDQDACDEHVYGPEPFNLRFGFSSRLVVLQFLVRLAPYSTAFFKQNGQMENPNRMFCDVNGTFQTVNFDKDYNHELIPQFFYLPEMFLNNNYLNVGTRDNNKNTNAVHLPVWAMSAHDFVRVNREALDSNFARTSIQAWIDMLFGVKQNDPSNQSVFFCLAYEEFHNDSWVKENIAPQQLSTMNEFMQMPSKVLNQPISKMNVNRRIASNANLHLINNINTPLNEENLYCNNTNEMSDPDCIYMNADQNTMMSQTDAMGGKKNQMYDSQHNMAASENARQMGQETNFKNLMDHFIENRKNKSKLKLELIAEHHEIKKEHNIIHMLFINKKRCMVFVREDDRIDAKGKVVKQKSNTALNANQQESSEFNNINQTGPIVVYFCRENFSKDQMSNNQKFNLQLRWEHLSGDLSSMFAEFADKQQSKTRYLYVCGYLDNSIRIFDLDKKPGQHLVHSFVSHKNRVTCIKFSRDFKYLISCDADGVIHHYRQVPVAHQQQLNSMQSKQDHPSINPQQAELSKQEKFPFVLDHIVQDQVGAILAIDINHVLDMYVTVAADGTIALRCLRSSDLWQLIRIPKFSSILTHVDFVKLSLHGYIVLIGRDVSVQQDDNQNDDGGQETTTSRETYVRYLVFSLNGDLLKSLTHKKIEIKQVYLNSREDQLIVFLNISKRKIQGKVYVLRLYGLDMVSDLTQVCYLETMTQIIANKKQQMIAAECPKIEAVALNRGERNLNIFYSRVDEPGATGKRANTQIKEIVCFDTSKVAVCEQFEVFGLR